MPRETRSGHGHRWLSAALAVAVAVALAMPAGLVAEEVRPALMTGMADGELSRLRPDAALWLELDTGERALGLFHPEQEVPAQGALVVLADVGENAASEAADGLARQLAKRGWASLVLGLPAPDGALQQSLEAPAEKEPEAEAGASADSSVMIDVMASPEAESPEQRYRARVLETLELAVTELSGRGYRRPALVGIGRASNHLVAASQAVPDAQALIWVAPEFYPQDAVTLANQLTAQSELAILELYSARNGGAADSRQRRAEALRAGFEGLDRQPVALQRPVSGHASGALAGRIAAWLENR